MDFADDNFYAGWVDYNGVLFHRKKASTQKNTEQAKKMNSLNKIGKMNKTLNSGRRFFVLLMLVSIIMFAVHETATAQIRRGRVMRSRIAKTARPAPSAQPAESVTPKKEPTAEKSPAKSTRRPQKTPATSETTAKVLPKIAPEEAETQIRELCQQILNAPKELATDDVQACKTRLTKAAAELVRVLNRDPNRQAAAYWRATLKVSLLQNALAKEEPSDATLAEVWQAFHSDHSGVKWLGFDEVRRELRRYRSLKMLQGNAFKSQMENVCNNLSNYVSEYAKKGESGYGIALSEVVCWLEDVSVIDARAAELASLILARFSHPNVHASASIDLVGVPFAQELRQEFPINENIQQTSVRGTGSISGASRAELLPAKDKAVVKLLVDVNMTSKTTGRQSVVTLSTDTSGTMKGEKTITISPIGVTTAPAQTKADLKSNIYNIRIDGGPIVQNAARNQIQQKRASSQAEGQRRSEQRMSAQIDDQLNPRIQEMNANYLEKIREPLVKTGLFPRIFDLSSSTNEIQVAMLIGDMSQAGAPKPVAELATKRDKNYDAVVRIHQSALNNAATVALAGKGFDEEKVMADLKKRFDELPAALNRPSDQKPIRLTFANREPISVSFMENKLSVVFRIDSFIQDDNRYPGLDITLVYDVKTTTETVEGENVVRVLLEQSAAPTAFPRGFDPNGQQSLSARHQAIRTIVMKRLETLQKTVELKAFTPKGDWDGKGQLVPKIFESRDGWLTVAWDWE